VRTGFVILTRRYAFKFPNLLGGWFQACWGMIDNMQERRAQGQQGICPLLWSLPGGLLNVMPRARELTPEEWLAFDYDGHVQRGAHSAERKPDSFGVLDGQIVAIDYGN
jgi:hypothetical protein